MSDGTHHHHGQEQEMKDMAARDERIDRATRLAAVILAAIVLTAFAVASVLLLAGCSDPCAGHGGIRSQGGGWTYCNDGTQVAGYG